MNLCRTPPSLKYVSGAPGSPELTRAASQSLVPSDQGNANFNTNDN